MNSLSPHLHSMSSATTRLIFHFFLSLPLSLSPTHFDFHFPAVVTVNLPIEVIQETSTNLEGFKDVFGRHPKYSKELNVLKNYIAEVCLFFFFSFVSLIYSSIFFSLFLSSFLLFI